MKCIILIIIAPFKIERGCELLSPPGVFRQHFLAPVWDAAGFQQVEKLAEANTSRQLFFFFFLTSPATLLTANALEKGKTFFFLFFLSACIFFSSTKRAMALPDPKNLSIASATYSCKSRQSSAGICQLSTSNNFSPRSEKIIPLPPAAILKVQDVAWKGFG